MENLFKNKIVNGDCIKELKKIPNDTFDLIFADPPYLKYDMSLLIESVLGHLNKKGKFILECDRKQEPILQASHKDYGQTRILFWENT